MLVKETNVKINDFIKNPNIRQGKVAVDIGAGQTCGLRMFKLEGATPGRYEIAYLSDTSSIEFCTVDTNLKLAILSYNCKYYNIDKLKEEVIGYDFLQVRDVMSWVYKHYNAKVNALLSKKIPDFLQIEECRNKVKEILNDERLRVRVASETAAECADYVFEDRPFGNDPSLSEFSYNQRSNLIDYIICGDRVDEIATEKAEKIISEQDIGRYSTIMKFMYCTGLIELQHSIINNPTDEDVIVIKTIEAFKSGGKTINVTTFEGDTFKVKNDLEMLSSYGSFRNLEGYGTVKLKDVVEATYKRKTIYKRDITEEERQLLEEERIKAEKTESHSPIYSDEGYDDDDDDDEYDDGEYDEDYDEDYAEDEDYDEECN